MQIGRRLTDRHVGWVAEDFPDKEHRSGKAQGSNNKGDGSTTHSERGLPTYVEAGIQAVFLEHSRQSVRGIQPFFRDEVVYLDILEFQRLFTEEALSGMCIPDRVALDWRKGLGRHLEEF